MVQTFQVTQHVDQQRTDRYFCTNITENTGRTKNQVAVLPYAVFTIMVVFTLFFSNFVCIRQTNHFDEHSQNNQQTCQTQIWNLNRRNLLGFADSLCRISQNQECPDLRSNGRTQRVECLNQSQCCRFFTWFGQQGHIRVTRHLQQRYT